MDLLTDLMMADLMMDWMDSMMDLAINLLMDFTGNDQIMKKATRTVILEQ